ncbi:MAG TPA: alpha/beta hydrolase [Thermoleophilaceae bacterium]|nr:alpha/beta hydrolase [Thermoleophilaceae bacterium]
MSTIETHRNKIDGTSVEWRSAPSPAGATPILYIHGVPAGSWEWDPFLRRTGGLAPTLPGFADSDKPDEFAYSMQGYGDFLERFTDELGLERFSLVVHDRGAVGLIFAQRHPERVERLVIFNCTPFTGGYRWHRLARVWRTPLLGELFWATATKPFFRRSISSSKVTPGRFPDEWIDRAWAALDRGTKRAILRLYRSAPESELERAGRRLGELRSPALILWAQQDIYLPAQFGQAYAEALDGDVTLEPVEGAGHWSWFDRPEVIDRAEAFLLERSASEGDATT